MELGRFFIKTKDNGLYHEVKIYEDMTVKVTSAPFWATVKRVFKMLKMVIFNKRKTTRDNYQETLGEEVGLFLYMLAEAQKAEGKEPIDVDKMIRKLNKNYKKPKKKTKKNKKKTKKKVQGDDKASYIG